ncbi:hypothetical protein E2562_033165 [Oryza meyeriana var. granulata]|uniref:Uncharacterized protein n=1 Tax=Oryza meyeriana var. granulata TaxID=110450 RepID=A0A6G1DRA5_9ORYZ|nr:hypothetical protein E2562_033165 [Oryza meyeriana var. granulata]
MLATRTLRLFSTLHLRMRGVTGHGVGNVSLGEAERGAGEESEDGVSFRWEFLVGDVRCQFHNLLPVETAGGDEVVLDGELPR